MKPDKKTVLVTGGTSGIGRAIAECLHGKGCIVYGAARRPEAAADVPFKTIRLDVNSAVSVAECVSSIVSCEGGIDVLVNCAGFGIAGPVEETPEEETRAQFETNYFGAVRMCQAVLPHMRAAGNGYIINISSLGGLVSVPFHAHYCASKFALEGLTEGLRMEVADFGIKAVLVEPGDYKTGFTSGRKISETSRDGSPYREKFINSLRKMEESEQKGPEPVPVARLVARIIETEKPKLRYAVAPPPQNLLPPLKRLLPWSIIEKIILANYDPGVKKK